MSEPVVRDELDRAWAVLSPPVRQELSSYPVGTTGLGSVCRVALDRYGVRHLLVPVEGEVLTIDPRPSVLSYTARLLRFGGDPALHLDVSCTEPELNAEFDEVAEDLLEAVRRSDSPGATATGLLMRWRRLFRTAFARGMSAQARMGLFAELVVFRELLQVRPTLPLAIWTGPEGRPHDFEAPHGCLEVKAVGSRRTPVTIHGVEQLEQHDDRALDLVIVTVVPDPAGLSLTELVDSVRSMIGEAAGLTATLRRLGWQPDSPAAQDTFVVEETFRVPVQEGLPRVVRSGLTGGRLPNGVVDLSYGLDFDVIVGNSAPGSLRDIASTVAG